MIKIFLGNVGSGKTACAVREMYLTNPNRITYSNIKCKLKNSREITPKMIITKIEDKKYEVNAQFWKEVVKKHKAVNVILDEAHTILNSRKSMSKTNIIVNDWLALIRRVLGSSDGSMGELTFITQLWNRIDIVAREMATQIRYHLCHYDKECMSCGYRWTENSDMPEKRDKCFSCGKYKLRKFNHRIEVWHFNKMEDFQFFKEFGQRTYYRHYLITDIEDYFPLYDSLQWENLFESIQ